VFVGDTPGAERESALKKRGAVSAGLHVLARDWANLYTGEKLTM
jgi:hypothetical protein